MDFLSNNVIISLIVLSFIIIIIAFIFLFFPLYRIYGITILIFYTIISTVSIGYFGSVNVGTGIPILLFIVILCVFLLLLVNIKSFGCSDPKSITLDKSCFEQFYTPVGITKLNDGKWCIRDSSGNCISSDGTSKKFVDPKLKNLKKNLSVSQEQCDKKMDELKKSISQIELKDKKAISPGPCQITKDKNKKDTEWGIILPKYGNKCVSMSSLIRDKVKNDKKDDKKIDYKKISKKEIDDMYNKLYKKQGIVRQSIMNVREVLELDKCYPRGTNFNEICKKNYGPFYKAQTPNKCPCPIPIKNKKDNMMNICDKTARFNARCECILPKDKKYTDCKPVTSDFNYWCKVKYGNNYGYREILKGTKGCCGKNDNMAIAECTTNAHDGFDMYNMATTCLSSNNYYDHLEACRNQYPKEDVIAVKNIGGYNCNPGYFKSECIPNVKKGD